MNRTDIANAVKDVIVSILPSVRTDEIRGDRHIRDLGADSVDRVEIIATLLQKLKLKLPLADFSALKDIDALIDYLCAACER
ncbi:phosphopantetheine-binding protein [Pseudomonas sp. H3(2019)]|uniref:phosphopantetheine-binding protein n=1 Tax=Pseudomonas sp. H3(2019) TaxID=2598724 RepID=UPI001194C6A1|nr:phosphopantetheine-binding protein [Pseudomonas sp. H3(2019)]TVT86072.1 acyl carrier protein [Pseudomonas sp. H3(2019)]